MYLDLEPNVTLDNDPQGFAQPHVFRRARLARLRAKGVGAELRAEARRLEERLAADAAPQRPTAA